MLSNLQCHGDENDLLGCKGWTNKKLGSGSCGKSSVTNDITTHLYFLIYDSSFLMNHLRSQA